MEDFFGKPSWIFRTAADEWWKMLQLSPEKITQMHFFTAAPL